MSSAYIITTAFQPFLIIFIHVFVEPISSQHWKKDNQKKCTEVKWIHSIEPMRRYLAKWFWLGGFNFSVTFAHVSMSITHSLDSTIDMHDSDTRLQIKFISSVGERREMLITTKNSTCLPVLLCPAAWYSEINDEMCCNDQKMFQKHIKCPKQHKMALSSRRPWNVLHHLHFQARQQKKNLKWFYVTKTNLSCNYYSERNAWQNWFTFCIFNLLIFSFKSFIWVHSSGKTHLTRTFYTNLKDFKII